MILDTCAYIYIFDVCSALREGEQAIGGGDWECNYRSPPLQSTHTQNRSGEGASAAPPQCTRLMHYSQWALNIIICGQQIFYSLFSFFFCFFHLSIYISSFFYFLAELSLFVSPQALFTTSTVCLLPPAVD